VTQTDLELSDGRTLHAYDTGADEADGRLAVFWPHGTPNIGSPPQPLFAAAEELGICWVSYDRPGYGGSTPHPGRDVASAAAYVSTIADWLGIARFALMGHSGGGPHALACAALLQDRVLGVVVVAGLAPFGAEGLDWFEGFGPAGVAELRAAAAGRAALEKHLAQSDDEPNFTPEDEAALAGEWSWFIDVVRLALAGGMGVHRRRSRLRRSVGLRPRRHRRSGPFPARMPGSGRAQLAWRVARAPLPLGGAVAVPGRRTHLGPELQQGGHGLAPGARRKGLSPAWPSCRSKQGCDTCRDVPSPQERNREHDASLLPEERSA
jgi:pimeloyl-ACP methyl ester carboxylesterase